MLPHFEEFSADLKPSSGITLGQSREGRDVVGYRLGSGETKISLIGGCHADEPVGPLLLQRIVAYLQSQPEDSELLQRFQWWIVPHVNPDGADRNARWAHDNNGTFDVATYLEQVVREKPGDDIEFGFPRNDDDTSARPENRAVYDWWRRDPRPFLLHASMHGMAFAGGPWFLIDPAWSDRGEQLMMRCHDITRELGYRLHDVQRFGEKGFVRIERGFATRPNSKAMASFFMEQGDPATAKLFRPSSMEVIRGFGGDALTLVSEVPLFILPGVGEQVAPDDPVATIWKLRIDKWREALANGGGDAVRTELDTTALQPMPIEHQMKIQWAFITAGIEQALGSQV